MTSSHEVSFADNFDKVARRAPIDISDEIKYVNGGQPTFRCGEIIAVVKSNIVSIQYSPEWMNNPGAEITSKNYHNFGDAVGWIFFYLDMYAPGHDMIEDLRVIQKMNMYFLTFSLSTSIESFKMRGVGRYDVSQIPDEIEYERKS